MIISRIVQGIGFGFVSVAAPSAIGRFIPAKMMSVSMGIWSTWIPVGSLIMFVFAPYITLYFPPSIYWIILLIILGLTAILYAMFIPKDVKKNETIKLPAGTVKGEVKNRQIWIVALTFASFTFSFFAFNTWAATYLVETSSISLAKAASIPAIISFFMIGSNLYGGYLLKKFQDNIFVYILPPILMALCWPMFLFQGEILLYGLAVVIGVVGGITPTIIFASAPKLALQKETIGIAMAIVIIGENAGILIGPEVFGILRDVTGNFTTSILILSCSGIITTITSAYIWRSWKTRTKQEAA